MIMLPTNFWRDFIITRIRSGYDDDTILKAINSICKCAIPDDEKHTAVQYQALCSTRKLAHIKALRASMEL
jgi:hypothetical protein